MLLRMALFFLNYPVRISQKSCRATKAGTEGTIVDILGNGKAFTVEFFDEDGNTIEASLCTEYTPEQLQKVETTLTLT